MALLCLGLLAADVALGTWRWSRPHTDIGPPRPLDWPCHATGSIFPLLILGGGIVAALYFTRQSMATLRERLLTSSTVGLLLIVPVIFAQLWWGVEVLACDTL